MKIECFKCESKLGLNELIVYVFPFRSNQIHEMCNICERDSCPSDRNPPVAKIPPMRLSVFEFAESVGGVLFLQAVNVPFMAHN